MSETGTSVSVTGTPSDAPAERKQRVLITGAAGRIGTSMAAQLKDRYDLRLACYPAAPDQPAVDDVVVADISYYEQIAPAMQGIDPVIPLAGEPSVSASWEE